jgi:Cytotoxic
VLAGFPHAQRVTRKTPRLGGGLRHRWKDYDGSILEWDYQHGRVEKYNSRGHHIGEFDPATGFQTKPADPTRRVIP